MTSDGKNTGKWGWIRDSLGRSQGLRHQIHSFVNSCILVNYVKPQNIRVNDRCWYLRDLDN